VSKSAINLKKVVQQSPTTTLLMFIAAMRINLFFACFGDVFMDSAYGRNTSVDLSYKVNGREASLKPRCAYTMHHKSPSFKRGESLPKMTGTLLFSSIAPNSTEEYIKEV
jgi:hypothetical protein